MTPRSPCIGIDLPREASLEEMDFLSHEKVKDLAEAIALRYRALIYTAACTAMRWGRTCCTQDRALESAKRIC
jgi:hypothetical protein